MLNALRSVRAQSPFLSNSHQPHHINRYSVTGIRFASGPNRPNSSDKMDQKQDIKPHDGDACMSSFGEGYVTRSDEEGFGGIYGGNQTLAKDENDKIVFGNAPEYDTSQGSEVKEKERARNQSKVVTTS